MIKAVGLVLALLYLGWVRYARQPRVWVWMGSRPPKTGGERYCEEIIQELRGRGYPVRGFDAYQIGTFTAVHFLPFLGMTLGSFCLSLFLGWCRGPFIVDEHFTRQLYLSNLWRRWWGGGPLIILIHHMESYDSVRHTRWARLKQKARLSGADLLVVVSDYTRREVASLGILAPMVVIPPGFDPSPTLASNEEPAPAPPLRLLCVGECSWRKGQHVLLKALRLLPAADFSLRVAGRNRYNPYYSFVLRPMVAKHKLNVTFEGRVSRERLLELYADSHVFVFPSIQEGFGIVLLEAMQSGLPVVASNATAIPELVEHDRTGLLFPPGDAEALAAALRSLTPAIRERMGRAARERMAEDRSWRRTRQMFYEAIKPLLEGDGPKAEAMVLV